jgi:hypothetical protein
MVLTAVERALKLAPRPDARPKITHCTLINDDLLRRIKALGAVPMPFTTYAYYNADKFHFYGEELMKRAMAYRIELIDSTEFPSGMGEPPVIAVAPAIGNAVFAAVGVRLRDLPMRPEHVLGELPSTVLPAREVAGRRTSV